ncbi:MAG: DUF3570 domain-containing protein [Methylococcaceae bacterium]|nr:DUF3570 domain-containing protein [Methylococcaceae bacterium]
MAQLNLNPSQKIFAISSVLPLRALTAAALVLPGLMYPQAEAADEDSVDFQYSHFQEGRRDGVYIRQLAPGGQSFVNIKLPDNRNPIEVDSVHSSARVSLTDRIKFAFNYIQDTWSGATPYGIAPEFSNAYRARELYTNEDGNTVYGGASPILNHEGIFDKNGNFYTPKVNEAGQLSYLKSRNVHVMGFASPETRKQGDFKLSYDWDDAALEAGGGISVERDYESRFVNLGGRMDFNQKQTTVNVGISYTNSSIEANPDITNFARWSKQHANLITSDPLTKVATLRANREDWAAQLGLTQVVYKDAVFELGASYTRSTGFLENPYKLSWLFGVDPDDPRQQGLPDGLFFADGGGGAFIEQRPDARDQWRWNTRWTQYVEPLDAALHLGYAFAHDDWGINAHTFDADWVQPLGDSWTITPRIRYYSQEAAYFYEANTFAKPPQSDIYNGQSANSTLIWPFTLPENFSSDQRLSGYGTLSGGVTVEKKFAKGLSLEAGFEYYTHQGSLKMGGGGEDSFADFDYWVANAALKVNLSALGQTSSSSRFDHANHVDHPNIPAGVLFGHTLKKAGDMMVGYRYMRNQQAGDFLHGAKSVSEQRILAKGCPGSIDNNTGKFNGGCTLLPREMTMSMHMLDLMVAPTDWLTLMLMPQFADMAMDNYQPASLIDPNVIHAHGNGGHDHDTGGIGDTGMYALVKLFDRPNHQLHTSLGVTAPTGDVGIRSKIIGLQNLRGEDDAYVHYGMQLGSGTWDFKPSLTYTGKADDWSWGAQAGGTLRLEGSNKSGYALGDLFETSVWGGYSLTHWLSTSVRAAYTWQGNIKGRFLRNTRSDYKLPTCNKADYFLPDFVEETGEPLGPPFFHEAEFNLCQRGIENQIRELDALDRPNPMDFPGNYGGQYVDIGFGLSTTVPSGSLAGNKLSFEWLQPVYTDVNGYQLDRDGALSFTWSYGF